MNPIIRTVIEVLFQPWVVSVVFLLLLLVCIFFFFFQKGKRDHVFKVLIASAIAFRLLYACFLTWGQYYAWSHDPISQYLLPPHQSINYFLFYAFSRFFLNFLISLVVAAVWYMCLKLLQRYRESLFDAGEIRLGFLCAFIAGWPHFVLFLPLVFICVIIVSLVRKIFLKQEYTSMGIPFLVSALTVLLLGSRMIELFHLTVLKI